jgi:HAE1 family hydrophobic/amphiphilic exporter-1
MKITEVAVDRPVATIMFFLCVMVVSVVSLSMLPIDLLPDVSSPTLTVVVEYPGAGPEEVETLLALPIEESMGSVSGVKEIESTCIEEVAEVRLAFDWGTNLTTVLDDVRQRLDRLRGTFPEETEPPYIYRYDINTWPIMRLGLAVAMTPMEMRELAERNLRPRIERIPGVAAVHVDGGLKREIQVNLFKDKLDNLHLTPSDIVDRLRAENMDAPVGEVAEGNMNLLVRTEGQIRTPKELENIVVARREGVPIHLRELAEVVDGHEEIRSQERVDGGPAVTMSIVKQSSTNVVDVANRINEEVLRIESEMPQVDLVTLYDNSRFVRDAISGVQAAALEGSVLAIIILLIFLHNIRATMIISLAIPVCVMASFSLLYFCGLTLNIMSFGGLALAVGLLVDDNIVVLENIYRLRHAGVPAREAAIRGTSEVSLAITASTLTTVVVFLPLLFLTGTAKILFGQMSYVVTFSLLCSLVISTTLLPMMCSRLLVVHDKRSRGWIERLAGSTESLYERFDMAYKRSLFFVLRHRVMTTFVCLSTLVMIFPYFRSLPFEYMPATDENEVRIYGEVAPGTRIEEMETKFLELERIAREELANEAIAFQTSFGMGSGFSNTASEGTVRIRLVDKHARTKSSKELADTLHKRIQTVPGISARARASGGLFVFRMLRGQGESLSVTVRGYDLETGQKLSEKIKEILQSVPGVADARIDDVLPRPSINLQIDRSKAAEAGLNVSDIAEAIRIKFGGEVATRYREEGEEYDVLVRLREKDRYSPDDLNNVWLVTPSGEKVAASNFLIQHRGMGPSQITRIDQERVFGVDANLAPNETLGNVMIRVQEAMTKLELPKGFRIVYGGEYEDQQDAFRQLMMGFILSVLLVYMVMAAQFESLLQPLLIMMAIPFALIGMVLALMFTNTTLNVQSILGTTMLAGIAVKNAIIMIDYTNLLRRSYHMPLLEAIAESGRRRLRPILMTTLTAILGLLPMAIGLEAGSELQVPLARVVVGGLCTSTLITLFFIPVSYSLLEEGLERARTGNWRRKAVGADVSGRSAPSEPAEIAK